MVISSWIPGRRKKKLFPTSQEPDRHFIFSNKRSSLVVRTTLKAVARRFSAKADEKSVEGAPTRRLLVVIRFVDGDWVLQKTQDFHKPGKRYKDEAKSLFQAMFPRKEENFCPKSKADKALHEVMGFRRPDDIDVGDHFNRDGIEWHPVVIRLDTYCLNSRYFLKRAKLEGRILTPIAEHAYAEKLLKRFPRL